MTGRRTFIKDMLGIVIGIAVLPTAIREMVESQTLLIPKGAGIMVQLPRGRFRKADILMYHSGRFPEGRLFYMTEDTQAVCLDDPNIKLDIQLVDNPSPTPKRAVRYCSALPEHTAQRVEYDPTWGGQI